jgi:hypothetical protein
MELFGVPPTPDAQAGGTERAEDVLNLGAWFQKGWTTAGSIGEKGADFVAGIFVKRTHWPTTTKAREKATKTDRQS